MIARVSALVAASIGFQLAAVGPNEAAPSTYGTYYTETIRQVPCNDKFNCRIDFSQTPSGKFFTIKNVACYIDSSKALRIIVLSQSLTLGGLSSASVPVPFSANFTNTTSYYHSINTAVYFKMVGARFPFMLAEASEEADIAMTCTISGDLG